MRMVSVDGSMPGATCQAGRLQSEEMPPPPAPQSFAVTAVVPHRFLEGVDVRHGEAPNARDVGLGGRVVDRGRRRVDPGLDALAVRGALVPRGRDDGLALGRHLLEDRLFDLGTAVGLVLADAPRGRDDGGGVVTRDLGVDVGRAAARCGTGVDLDRGAGRERRGLFDVEGRLVGRVVGVVGTGRTSVDEHRLDVGRDPVAAEVGGHVTRVVGGELVDADRLTDPRLARGPRVVEPVELRLLLDRVATDVVGRRARVAAG